jgi:hypothetical protein
MPAQIHLDRAIEELAQVSGDRSGAERNISQAFRLLIALEALGVGRIAGGTMNICGKLSAVPLLDPPNDEILEIGTLYGMFGAAGAAARVQQGFSEDPEVRALVSDRSYGVIIVDGDHSAAGVAADLEWAEQIVAPGGIVVLDDFGHPKWPGIKEAFDKHMATDTRLTFLGQVANSGYLRASA